ncbi:MAG: 16S rRNA (uracil(1498)-N(3))-methyltransferase [Blastocatellia bacterium]|nr:16S rRNA (uracil(1498)-N(3))-methyltransferase [Blastocatellia bacterium]MCX7753159.1 16S rRNA (uracil(1498)-N(3))-methyltransferase [Blastocatellia bacterium]MDW8169474.1 16S rRNA (uracil(1498)-N(3))-methyltransferase [Acidobacteriota bacterium]
MSLHRFYAPPEAISQGVIRLDERESHHLRHVLRLKPGARVIVFDGTGIEYEGVVLETRERCASVSVRAQATPAVESPLELTLAQALTKGEKFDLVVQKATELGVHRIIPLLTRYVVMGTYAPGRLERWRRIALEAAKQSRRTRLVHIEEPQPVRDLLSRIHAPALFCAEREGVSLREIAKRWAEAPPQRLIVFIGPEGGWADEEIEAARKAGAILLSLGPRILRTETAGLVVLSVAQFLWGDL